MTAEITSDHAARLEKPAARKAFVPVATARSFRISMNDPVEALFLPPLLRRCIADAPGIGILCTFVDRHELTADTLDRAVDVPTASGAPPAGAGA